MTWDQALIALIIAGTMAVLIWGRWRYDVVAMASLMICVLAGLVPVDRAFSGFSDPAVITVAAVLIISGAVSKSGAVDLVAGRLTRVTDRTVLQVLGFCCLGTLLSAFMNNVAALALVMPVALSAARRLRHPPALMLMPLSFATLLGGMITLIGTPPNLLVSNFRLAETGRGFDLFDFAPVGLAVSLAGLGYLGLVIWRRLAGHAQPDDGGGDIFDVADYVTEARVRPGSALVGRAVAEIEGRRQLSIAGVIRDGKRLFGRLAEQAIAAGDILLLQAETRGLEALIADGGLEIVEVTRAPGGTSPAEIGLVEAVVTPNSLVLGSTPSSLELRQRFGVTLLAAARQGRRFEGRLSDATLNIGDVLLFEGPPAATQEAVKTLGCLPLAKRELNLAPRRAVLPILLFAAAIALAAWELLPTEIAFTCCALAMILARTIRPAEALESVNWPVIVLLAAIIPIGGALETTGTASLIAHSILDLAGGVAPLGLLAISLIATMAITPLLNNAATVIIMAPIVLGVARDLGLAPEAFLMAVAVGASCDFLTPFGHHNNTIILGPGRYRFVDFLKLGLPLDAIVLAVALVTIPLVWPL